MTIATKPSNPKDDARAVVDDARAMLNQRKGELVAVACELFNVTGPPSICAAVRRVDDAERWLEVTRARLASTPATVLEGPDAKGREHCTRISALVAAHIVGAELVASDRPFYPWAMRHAHGGRLVDVPNYTADVTAVAHAEACLPTDIARQHYGAALRMITGEDPFLLACAPPYARAVALLRSYGVSPDADPPTTPLDG